MSHTLLAQKTKGGAQEPHQGPSGLAHVFISYSRRDAEFAEWLRENLKACGYEANLDQHDILPGEEWRERLSGLVQTADTVAFCVSPNFAASETCNWELSEAERMGKRLLPLIAVETPESSVPEQLRRRNYIFMRNAAERSVGLPKLAEAINTDIDWIRNHTRYGEHAYRWTHGNRSRDLLIRGTALQAMEKWLREASASKPILTTEIKLFLSESRKEEARRAKVRRRTIFLVSVLAVASILVGGGWWWQDLVREQVHWRLVMKASVPPDTQEADLRSQPGRCSPTVRTVVLGWSFSRRAPSKWARQKRAFRVSVRSDRSPSLTRSR